MRRLKNPLLLGTYLSAKLPLAAIAGVRVSRLDADVCEATIPFRWRSQNPFGSIYFAALTMAAEMSCAGLALAAGRSGPKPMSVLPTHLEADFFKKAKSLTTFRCSDGPKFFAAAEEARQTGQGVVVNSVTEGRDADGVLVARLAIDWSFKEKR